LKALCGIKAIVDVEIIQMNSHQVYLYVLHQSDFDKAVATLSKQPITRLTIFEFVKTSADTSELVP
jgi:hypothetical protein